MTPPPPPPEPTADALREARLGTLQTLDRLLDRFSQDGRSFVQVLRGEGAPDGEEIERRIGARGMEADVKWGGQPHYPLLLSAE